MKKVKKSPKGLPVEPMPGPRVDEIIGIQHPFADEDLIKRVLPRGPHVEVDLLQRVAYLLTHPVEMLDRTFSETLALATRLNEAVDRDFQEAQEANVRQTGKARP